jgi:hypothetical protein
MVEGLSYSPYIGGASTVVDEIDRVWRLGAWLPLVDLSPNSLFLFVHFVTNKNDKRWAYYSLLILVVIWLEW